MSNARDDEVSAVDRTTATAITAAFGKANRGRLLSLYFAGHANLSTEDAWAHVYRLLLWIDPTTGLAHCYESDKSQPGRHWYARSLAFHAWAATALGTTPTKLGSEIDWLFKRAVDEFNATVAKSRGRVAEKASQQRAAYAGQGMPEPEDPALVAIVNELVGPYLQATPPESVWTELTSRIREHLAQENKRKNLVGEGFEDTLAAVVGRVSARSPVITHTRIPIESIPGFNPPRPNEKPKKVDLFVGNTTSGHRTLVTAKWSIRADREEQFASDYEAYARLEAQGNPFDYVLLTNEFDPARLLAACERRTVGQLLFTHVVHINPNALLAVYGHAPAHSATKVVQRIQERRLIGLGDWLRLVSLRE